MKIKFPNGQELELAPANFTEDAILLVELTEEAGEHESALKAALQKHPEIPDSDNPEQDEQLRLARAAAIDAAAPPFRKFGKILRLLRGLVRDSLQRAGASPADAEAALSSISMDDSSKMFLSQIRSALGVD